MSTGLCCNMVVMATLVRRELLKLKSERARLFGLVLQPLMLWFFFSFGFDSGFGSAVAPASGQSFLAYFFPGALVMTILFASVFASMTVIDDRAGGFLQSVMTSPATTLAIMAGKTGGVMLVALLQVVLVLLAGTTLLGQQWNPEWFALAAWAVVSVFALVPINLAVALWLNSTQAFHAFMGVVLFPVWAFSGALFPMRGDVLHAVAMANPLTYMVGGFRQTLWGAATWTEAQSPDLLFADTVPMDAGPFVLVGLGVCGLVLASLSLRRTSHSL